MDFIFASRPKCFQQVKVIKSELADFHKMKSNFVFFKITLDSILQKHALLKKRCTGKSTPFINSKIRREIRRTQLRNTFIDPNTDGDRVSYNKQCNYYFSLIHFILKYAT